MCLSFIWLPAYSLIFQWARLPYTPEVMHLFGRSVLRHYDKHCFVCQLELDHQSDNSSCSWRMRGVAVWRHQNKTH